MKNTSNILLVLFTICNSYVRLTIDAQLSPYF